MGTGAHQELLIVITRNCSREVAPLPLRLPIPVCSNCLMKPSLEDARPGKDSTSIPARARRGSSVPRIRGAEKGLSLAEGDRAGESPACRHAALSRVILPNQKAARAPTSSAATMLPAKEPGKTPSAPSPRLRSIAAPAAATGINARWRLRTSA